MSEEAIHIRFTESYDVFRDVISSAPLPGLLARLAEIGAVDQTLVEAEVRPLLRGLEQRLRHCDNQSCRRWYLQKRRRDGARHHCSTECANRGTYETWVRKHGGRAAASAQAATTRKSTNVGDRGKSR